MSRDGCDDQRVQELELKLARAEKVKQVLMERVERSLDEAGSAFHLFERNILLEQHVEQRTAELAQVNQQLLAAMQEQEVARQLALAAQAEAVSANLAKSQFLANVSHEIRTPMNGILGLAEVVLDGWPDPSHRQFMEIILASARSLHGLVNDILDFTKFESGKFSMEVTTFPLRQTLDEATQAMVVQAGAKGLALLCRIDPDVPDLLRGDPLRLKQVLLNLIGNAVKFTDQGEVSVQVSVQRELDDAVVLHFCVEDTGIGIPADKQEMIFELFCQADGSTTRKYGGTGLGLTISRQLAELMGGSLQVASEEGRGSRFFFDARFDLALEPAAVT